MRKVIIIDNDRIGIFDLCKMETTTLKKRKQRNI